MPWYKTQGSRYSLFWALHKPTQSIELFTFATHTGCLNPRLTFTVLTHTNHPRFANKIMWLLILLPSTVQPYHVVSWAPKFSSIFWQTSDWYIWAGEPESDPSTPLLFCLQEGWMQIWSQHQGFLWRSTFLGGVLALAPYVFYTKRTRAFLHKKEICQEEWLSVELFSWTYLKLVFFPGSHRAVLILHPCETLVNSCCSRRNTLRRREADLVSSTPAPNGSLLRVWIQTRTTCHSKPT